MTKFLAYIKPQVEEIINDLFFAGYYPDDLKKPLTSKMYWYQSPAYESATLNFDSAEMKIVGWISASEAITDNEEPFNLALIELFTDAIESQWATRMEVLANDGYEQLKLNAELTVKDVA